MLKEDLVRCMHSGIKRACGEYGSWSGGESIHDRGIESLMVSSVARQVVKGWKRNANSNYLSMETPFKQIAIYSDATPVRGRLPRVLDGNRRADLALWNANSQVRSVIEVKKIWSNIPCHNDIRRLIALINRYGRKNGSFVHTGYLITMIVVRRDELESKFREIKDSVNKFAYNKISVICHKPCIAYRDDERDTMGYSFVIELRSSMKGDTDSI